MVYAMQGKEMSKKSGDGFGGRFRVQDRTGSKG
jgi:hypothetical protein